MLLVFASWVGSGASRAGYVFHLRAQSADGEARAAELRAARSRPRARHAPAPAAGAG